MSKTMASEDDCIDAFPEDNEGGGDQLGARGVGGGDAQYPPPKTKESDCVSGRYKIDYNKRGIALIFNNKTFDSTPVERAGTDVDAKKMESLFKLLGFEEVRRFDNLTASKMKDKVEECSKENHSDRAMFACVILSHGEGESVYGTDKKIPIDELVEPFKGHNCNTLAGKPKLFFIQACRGNKTDPGTTSAEEECELECEAMEESDEMEEDVADRIPCEADFLIAHSAVPGYVAFRTPSLGSWFIQAIYEVFSQQWQSLDVLTMMTMVNNKVASAFESKSVKEEYNRKKQIPCITSMLTKPLFFK